MILSLVRPCLIFASPALLLLGANAYAQSESLPATQYSGQNETISRMPQPVTTTQEPPPVPAALQPTDAESQTGAGVDTAMAWSYIHSHDVAHAQEEIARLRQENPGWTPPLDMQDALAQDEIDQSRRALDSAAIRADATAHPEMFTCKTPYNMWTLADADIAKGDRKGANDLYNRLVSTCDEPAILSTLDQASGRVSSADMAALVAEANGRALSDAGRKHVALLADQSALAATAAANAGRMQDVRKYGLAAGPAIIKAHDAAGATALGWLEFKAGQMQEASKWFKLSLGWTRSPDALKGAALAAAKLGRPQDVDALIAQYGKTIPAGMDKTLGDIYADAAGQTSPRDLASASDYARKAAAYGNDSGWTSVGWALLNANRPGDAIQAFLKAPAGDASAITGRALALMRTGDLSGARQLVCRDGEPLKAKLCGDVLVASADQAYKAEQWSDVRAIAAEARKLGAENRGLLVEDGWSAYHLGQYDGAAKIFEALYDAQPDQDVADGLVTALRAAGRDADAAQMALGKGGALAASYSRAQSAADYARKQFVAAEDSSPGAYPALSNVGSADLGGGIAYRSRSGAPGQDSVSAISENLTGGDSFGRNILDARVENTTMDIGTAHPGDPVGSVAGLWAVKPTSSANLVTPDARWRYQGDISYEADLGMTPLNGDIGAHPVGSGSVTLNGDRSGLTGTVFSQTRWDSLLSAAGMVDPVTGTHWGRVTETGAQAEGWLGLGGNWSVSGRALGSALSGDQVEDNSRVALSTALDYTLKPEGFDYVRLGPVYNFESYDKNLDHFTLGNGGYYSPQSLNAPALAVEVLTQEGERWQFWGRADIGLNFQSESASPYFPLTGGGGPAFASSTSSGVAGDLAARASYLLSPNWIADAYAWTSLAPNYSEAVVGLGLTYSFEPRQAVVSSDLPDYTGQSRY